MDRGILGTPLEDFLRDQLLIELEVSWSLIKKWENYTSLLSNVTLAIILVEKYSKLRRVTRLIKVGTFGTLSSQEKYLLCIKLLPLLLNYLLERELITSTIYRDLLNQLSLSEFLISEHIRLITLVTKIPTLINEEAARNRRDASCCPCY